MLFVLDKEAFDRVKDFGQVMHDLERTDKRRQFEDSSGEHEEMLTLGDHIGNYRMLIDIAHVEKLQILLHFLERSCVC